MTYIGERALVVVVAEQRTVRTGEHLGHHRGAGIRLHYEPGPDDGLSELRRQHARLLANAAPLTKREKRALRRQVRDGTFRAREHLAKHDGAVTHDGTWMGQF